MAESKNSSIKHLGFIIFGILGFLTLIEFVMAIYFNSWVILAFLATLKAGLVLYYYMHIHRLFDSDIETDRQSYAYKLVTSRLGLWLFMLSDAFIFGGLLISRFNLMGFTRPELSQPLGLAITSILLVSSFFANRAETSMANGDRKQFTISTIITIVLGVLFILGVLGVEWQIAPFKAADGVQGAVFYSMTGFHVFHVLTGVIFLIIVLRNSNNGHYSEEKHWAVEASAVYWHFIDVVWIFFYPALYLIGTLHL